MARGSKKRTSRKKRSSNWGGARPGAGRPPKNGVCAGVSHLARAPHDPRRPLLVTLRLAEGLPSLRDRSLRTTLADCFGKAGEKEGFLVDDWGVTRDRVHLIVEADSRERLARGMQGLCIRLARTLNRRWERSGTLFADRYEDWDLRTAGEERDAREALAAGRSPARP